MFRNLDHLGCGEKPALKAGVTANAGSIARHQAASDTHDVVNQQPGRLVRLRSTNGTSKSGSVGSIGRRWRIDATPTTNISWADHGAMVSTSARAIWHLAGTPLEPSSRGPRQGPVVRKQPSAADHHPTRRAHHARPAPMPSHRDHRMGVRVADVSRSSRVDIEKPRCSRSQPHTGDQVSHRKEHLVNAIFTRPMRTGRPAAAPPRSPKE